MAFVVEQDEASRPIAVDILGSNAVVPCPDGVAHLVQEFWWFAFHPQDFRFA
jgi:hypothetical protein